VRAMTVGGNGFRRAGKYRILLVRPIAERAIGRIEREFVATPPSPSDGYVFQYIVVAASRD